MAETKKTAFGRSSAAFDYTNKVGAETQTSRASSVCADEDNDDLMTEDGFLSPTSQRMRRLEAEKRHMSRREVERTTMDRRGGVNSWGGEEASTSRDFTQHRVSHGTNIFFFVFFFLGGEPVYLTQCYRESTTV